MALGAILLVTAVMRIGPAYKLFAISSVTNDIPRTVVKAFALLALLAIAIGGSCASLSFARKFFLEDSSAMNEHYQQALFSTCKRDRAGAVGNLDEFEPAFAVFTRNYTTNVRAA